MEKLMRDCELGAVDGSDRLCLMGFLDIVVVNVVWDEATERSNTYWHG